MCAVLNIQWGDFLCVLLSLCAYLLTLQNSIGVTESMFVRVYVYGARGKCMLERTVFFATARVNDGCDGAWAWTWVCVCVWVCVRQQPVCACGWLNAKWNRLMSLYNSKGVRKRTLPINYFHMAFTSSPRYTYNCITKKQGNTLFLHRTVRAEQERKSEREWKAQENTKSFSTHKFVLIYHGSVGSFFPSFVSFRSSHIFFSISRFRCVACFFFFYSETNTHLP